MLRKETKQCTSVFGIEELHPILCVPEGAVGASGGEWGRASSTDTLFPSLSSRVQDDWPHLSPIQALGTTPAQHRAGKQNTLYPESWSYQACSYGAKTRCLFGERDSSGWEPHCPARLD